jgi:hypothetical protein
MEKGQEAEPGILPRADCSLQEVLQATLRAMVVQLLWSKITIYTQTRMPEFTMERWKTSSIIGSTFLCSDMCRARGCRRGYRPENIKVDDSRRVVLKARTLMIARAYCILNPLKRACGTTEIHT